MLYISAVVKHQCGLLSKYLILFSIPHYGCDGGFLYLEMLAVLLLNYGISRNFLKLLEHITGWQSNFAQSLMKMRENKEVKRRVNEIKEQWNKALLNCHF